MSNLIVVSVDPTHADHKKPITLTDDERYKYCGFRSLNELKDYATHMGKTYSGTSFDECYSMLFGKNATEVANINKERHSKFVKPVSVKDRLDKKRERLERLEQLNNDNITIFAKLEQLQIRLEREDVFNKIGELNRKLVALEAFKLNLENKPTPKEFYYTLILPSSSNTVWNFYQLHDVVESNIDNVKFEILNIKPSSIVLDTDATINVKGWLAMAIKRASSNVEVKLNIRITIIKSIEMRPQSVKPENYLTDVIPVSGTMYSFPST